MEKFAFFNELENKEPRFDSVLKWEDENGKYLYTVEKDEKKFLIHDGLIKKCPENCYNGNFMRGLCKIKKNNKEGFADRKGNIVIEPKYVFIYGSAREDLICCRFFNGEKSYGYIDHKGNEVVSPSFDIAYPSSEGMAAVGILGKNGHYKYEYIYKTGKVAIDIKYDCVSTYFYKGFTEARVGNRIIYINKAGKEVKYITKRKPEFYDGLMDFCQDRKYGFINEKNEISISPEFSSVKFFSEGLCGVKRKGEKWGFIDKKGNNVIKSCFDSVTCFFEGLCAVKVGGKWGFINKKGDMVIEPCFNTVRNFEANGKCVVREKDLYGVIDKNGNYVLEPLYEDIELYDTTAIVFVEDSEKGDIVSLE